MKDNNTEKENTIEIPLLKSDLIKKLYGEENNVENLEQKEEINLPKKIEEKPLPSFTSNERTDDIQKENNNEKQFLEELGSEKNDKLSNEIQEKDKGIEKTKVFNFKEFEQKKYIFENLEEETKKENKKIFKRLIPLSLLILILVCIITVKNYSYSFQLEQYETNTEIYDKNIDASVKIYEGNSKIKIELDFNPVSL